MLLSSVVAENPTLAIFGTGWRRLGLFTQLAILFLSIAVADWLSNAPERISPERISLIWKAVVVAGLPLALLGVCQYLGYDPIFNAQFVQFSGQFRPPGAFGNPTYFANYLIFPIFSGLGLVMTVERGIWRWLGWTAAAMGSFAVLLSGTRSVIGSLVLGLALLTWRSRPRWSAALTWGLAVFALLVGIFVVSAPGGKLRKRMGQWVQDPGGPRLLLFRDSFRLARDHLLIGTGPDCFEAVFPRYQSPELARAYPDFYEESPHNICLEYLTSLGIGGLLCFWAISGLAMTRTPNVRNPDSAILSACLVASFAAHQFTVFILPTALLYFVFLGCSIGILQTRSQSTTAVPTARHWVDPCAFCIAALFILTAVQWCLAEFSWSRLRSDLDAGNMPAVLRDYRILQRIPPPVPGLDLWLSQILAAWTSARSEAERSTVSLREPCVNQRQ
jgi:O-antigen ligase